MGLPAIGTADNIQIEVVDVTPRSGEARVGRFDIGGGVGQEDCHTVVVGSLAAAHVDAERHVAAAGHGTEVDVAVGTGIDYGIHVGAAGSATVGRDIDGMTVVAIGTPDTSSKVDSVLKAIGVL